MKDQLKKLIDVKSIVTLALIACMIFLVVYSAITGKDLTSNLFLLFSNIVTMVITYFFTKKKNAIDEKSEENADKE